MVEENGLNENGIRHTNKLDEILSTTPNSKRWMHRPEHSKRSAMMGKPEWYPHQPPKDTDIRDFVPTAFGLRDYYEKFKKIVFSALDI